MCEIVLFPCYDDTSHLSHFEVEKSSNNQVIMSLWELLLMSSGNVTFLTLITLIAACAFSAPSTNYVRDKLK